MKIHELKVRPEYYPALVDESKPFEWRLDDRGFEVGDILQLREWCPLKEEYTGRELQAVISYRLETQFAREQFPYVVLGLQRPVTKYALDALQKLKVVRIQEGKILVAGELDVADWNALVAAGIPQAVQEGGSHGE